MIDLLWAITGSKEITMFNKALLSLCLSLIVSAHAASLNPETLVGEYLGKGSCGVRVEVYRGDYLQFTILRSGKKPVSDTVPFYKMETVSSDKDSFEFEKEFFGARGEETKIISGKVKRGKLTSITLKTRRSLFSSKSESCRDLTTLGAIFND